MKKEGSTSSFVSVTVFVSLCLCVQVSFDLSFIQMRDELPSPIKHDCVYLFFLVFFQIFFSVFFSFFFQCAAYFKIVFYCKHDLNLSLIFFHQFFHQFFPGSLFIRTAILFGIQIFFLYFFFIFCKNTRLIYKIILLGFFWRQFYLHFLYKLVENTNICE